MLFWLTLWRKQIARLSFVAWEQTVKNRHGNRTERSRGAWDELEARVRMGHREPILFLDASTALRHYAGTISSCAAARGPSLMG
jgi:hypothetical protein